MTDIFFSYSSADRERVRPIRDALVEQGFEVFWDQEVPAGKDWDTWIRQHLAKSKCAMVFWSVTSVSSDNVRHEATVAKQQSKLVSVLLEPLTAQQFPMGLYTQQAANLSNWNGDCGHEEWCKLRRDYEDKLTPPWVRRQLDEMEAELVGERARREGAERRDKIMQARIAKEAEVQQDLKQERNQALDEVAALKVTVEELTRARSEAEAKQAETQQGLKRQLEKALDETATLKATVQELTQARSDAEERQVAAQQEIAAVKERLSTAIGERDRALEETADAKGQLAAIIRERDPALEEIAAPKDRLALGQFEAEAAALADVLHERVQQPREQFADLGIKRQREIDRSTRKKLKDLVLYVGLLVAFLVVLAFLVTSIRPH